ncbi:MAG: efflux RND transporter periplasmic adaptor subunit, partial [Gammaproteobacteria bacterium]|nr:efflux RND transporter periplasmic adaptor subunit [Gammaproteobacteria bacterium]
MLSFEQTQGPGRMRQPWIRLIAVLIIAGLLVGYGAAEPPAPAAGETDGERLAGA